MTTPETFLLVDDDETFTQVLARALSKRGHQVLTACNSEEALQLAGSHRVTKALVDLKMEGETGLQLIPELKKLPVPPTIVMLTGYSSIATTVEAIKLGALNYLCKPASIEEILNAFSTGNSTGNAVTIPASPPSVDRLEWEHIQKVLNEHEGNISATARALGMHRRTLQRKLQKKPVRK
jgi:two-component system response regulator RegA